MPSDESRDFAAASGVANHHDVFQIQLLEQLRQVIGVRVHVVAIPRLAGTSVAAPVVCDAAKAVRVEEKHLRFPGIGTQRPAVAERDNLSGLRPPVLVVNLRSIFCRDRAHVCLPWLRSWLSPRDATRSYPSFTSHNGNLKMHLEEGCVLTPCLRGRLESPRTADKNVRAA